MNTEERNELRALREEIEAIKRGEMILPDWKKRASWLRRNTDISVTDIAKRLGKSRVSVSTYLNSDHFLIGPAETK